MDATAIKAIADLAILAERESYIGSDTPAVLTRDGKLLSLEHLDAQRSRFRGQFLTNTFGEFTKYVTAQREAQIFVNPDGLTAKAFFNLGTQAEPGHGDWTAKLCLTPTAAFQACLNIKGQHLSQKSLVHFIEDWLPMIEGRSDKASTTAEKVLAAVRQLKIKAGAESNHNDRDLGASRSRLESIEASSNAGKLPRYLVMAGVTPYLGFQPRDISFRFAIHPDQDAPRITLHQVQEEKFREDLAVEFVGKLTEDIGGLHTVTVGTFTP